MSDALERGDLPGLPAWASAPGDDAPSLTVRLALPTQLDRVVVSTHSIGSIVPGLRSYDVSVQGLDGAWTTVGALDDRFFARRQLVSFAPRVVTAVRVGVRSINHGGMAGGLKPWYWKTDAASVADANAPWYGPAVVYEVEAYAPTTVIDSITPIVAPAPEAPARLVASPTSATDVSLSWTASLGATTYRVERSTDNVTFVPVIAGVTATTFADIGLAKRTVYHYRVVATNAGGDSPAATAMTNTLWGLKKSGLMPDTTS